MDAYDESRMVVLRFNTDHDGPFLDNNMRIPTPPWSFVLELQDAAQNFENKGNNEEVRKWLGILMVAGSSLGGARPKANIRDENGDLWIAKFSSKNDATDKAAWEYLAYFIHRLMTNCLTAVPKQILNSFFKAYSFGQIILDNSVKLDALTKLVLRRLLVSRLCL
ncbi:hypothetical protein [Gelidibacter maritimus]|uniref:Uncharacterized protein n=1 Tax=Gelidibacter maritimus TaxID=2761487 RepID=A0A7W2R3T5_9FLAO|nr:hypothetical protein [Gelidibacter maritimus]MBA6153134.1 hypothetical protein [Gelidibacter maritimus]